MALFKTPEERKASKEAFQNELKDFETRYGKVLDAGTELYKKFRAGKNSSIVQNAKNNIFEFPVFVSSSVPFTYATATATLLEQMYASFVQMTLSQQPIVNAKDISKTGGANDPFRYLRSLDVNSFLNEYDTEFQKDSIHSFIINEQTQTGYEFNVLAYPDNDASAILEAVENMNTDPYAHFFQEAKTPKPKPTPTPKPAPTPAPKPTPKPTSPPAAKDDRPLKKLPDDKLDELLKLTPDSQEVNYEKKMRNKEYIKDLRDAAKEKREQDAAETERIRLNMDMDKAMRSTPPKMIKEGEINKLNTMKPLMMEAHFGTYTTTPEGDIADIENVTMIIGVRSYCRLVNAEDLPDMARYSDSKNVLMKHAKYRAGEIKYWRDFKFDIKGKQNDVYENLKTPEKKWYKRLYQMAHMRDDAIAPLVARKGIRGALQHIDSQAANGMIPNCSLVLSQADVDYIKAVTSQNGGKAINILNPSTAKKLCSDMFLISIVVIDPDQESVKMMIPDLNGDWEVQSLDTINRQIATMTAAGIKSNEIFKMIAH